MTWFILNKMNDLYIHIAWCVALRTSSLLSVFEKRGKKWFRGHCSAFWCTFSLTKDYMLSTMYLSVFHVSIYLELVTFVPSFEHTHSLIIMSVPVSQLTTRPLNRRNKNGPLRSLETFMSSKNTFSTKMIISTAGCLTITMPQHFLVLLLMERLPFFSISTKSQKGTPAAHGVESRPAEPQSAPVVSPP